jgi:hypothetical protein
VIHRIAAICVLFGLSIAVAAKQPGKVKLTECWKVSVDSVRTGDVVVRPTAPSRFGKFDVDMYRNPFRWLDPQEVVPAAEEYVLCTTSGKNSRGITYFSGVELPTINVPYSKWSIDQHGSWSTSAEPSDMIQISIDPQTEDARVIILRGHYMKRRALLGTGKASRITIPGSIKTPDGIP